MRAAARGRLTRSNGKEFGLHDRPAECVQNQIGERVLSNDGSAARVRAMQSARGDPPAIVLTPQSVSAKAARALRAGAGAGAGARRVLL